jgi:hypothetical protein
MTKLLDPTTADRLAKLCGLFSSEHDGERATAAAMADKLIRGQGLTWLDVFQSTREPSTVEGMIDFALCYGDGVLTIWEEGFLHGICGRQFLTTNQLEKLQGIVAKVSAGRAAA